MEVSSAAETSQEPVKPRESLVFSEQGSMGGLLPYRSLIPSNQFQWLSLGLKGPISTLLFPSVSRQQSPRAYGAQRSQLKCLYTIKLGTCTHKLTPFPPHTPAPAHPTQATALTHDISPGHSPTPLPCVPGPWPTSSTYLPQVRLHVEGTAGQVGLGLGTCGSTDFHIQEVVQPSHELCT